MSRKSTPSRPTPPRTPSTSNQRHSIGATPNKKSLPVFNSYMSLFQVQEKLKKGEVIEGVLRINPKSYEDAYISAPEGGMDIYIGGVHDRNTALNGDLVAAQINPPDNWKVCYYRLDAYLEEHSDLKALVYKPIEPNIICSENAFISSLPNTTKTNITNIEEHLSNRDSGSTIDEKENSPLDTPSNTAEHPAPEKRRKRHRRKKKQVVDALKDSFKASSTPGENSPCERLEASSPPSRVAAPLKEAQCSSKVVVVPPHELSECELSDNESVSSLNLETEDKPTPEDRVRGGAPDITEVVDILSCDIRNIEMNVNKDSPVPLPSNSLLTKRNCEPSLTPSRGNPNSPCIVPDQSFRRLSELNSPAMDSSMKSERMSPTPVQVMRLENWYDFIQRTAVVVKIMERNHPLLAAGILKPFADKNPHMALFSPFDSRIPRIRIPMKNCPSDFILRPSDYSKIIMLARIAEWNDSKFAFGELVKNIGGMGDIEAETDALLYENGVDFSEFPEEALSLPKLPWTIPAQELACRTDLRGSTAFTIDPSSARDLDDAVSCLRLPSGNFRIGVHIADVTYFVEDGSPLDNIAASRATSVYLVQKVIPMLPRVLCENLCSLNPGEDRLSFSVVWELDPNGNILGEWFGRTVINSCTKLSYEHAQSMIESEVTELNPEEFPEVRGDRCIADIATCVKDLHQIAIKLREKRKRGGALRLDQMTLGFSLDSELKEPNGVFIYEQRDSNRLIEEFMLLANIAVSQKIYAKFPEIALLRRHPPPHNIQLANNIEQLGKLGIVLDPTSSKSLNASLQKYEGSDPISIAKREFIVNMCSKPMQCARYFCTGVSPDTVFHHHYALNIPCYTHFTSPIRRYPDIIVHRTLAAAIDPTRFPLPAWTKVLIAKKADLCNQKKQSSKCVQEVSRNLFLALFVRKLRESVETAVIVAVFDKSVDVLVLRYGVIKRCYLEKCPITASHFTESKSGNTLLVEWKEDPALNLPPLTQKLFHFQIVSVTLRPFENGALKFNAFLERPDKPLNKTI